MPLITALLAAPELADVLILQGDIFVEVAHLAIIFVQTSDEYAVEDKCMSRYFQVLYFCVFVIMRHHV